MSVYKSRRKDAAAEFITTAREFRKTTMRIIRKFPTSYRFIMTNAMLESVTVIYKDCIKANSIFLHKDMSEQDFDLRHRYLVLAKAETESMLAEISFCYELIDDGNNFFKDKQDYEKQFSHWISDGNIALKKIQGVIESDKKRYNAYQTKKQEAKATSAQAPESNS